jgi:hypothetical protein
MGRRVDQPFPDLDGLASEGSDERLHLGILFRECERIEDEG